MRSRQNSRIRREQRSDGLLWALVLGALAVVVGALLLRSGLFGEGSEPAGPDVATQDLAEGSGLPPGEFVVRTETPPPDVTGQAVVVLEQSCGALLYGHNAHDRRAPASLTKIATALVAADRAGPSDLVDVGVNSALLRESNGSSVMGLKPGQQLSMRDLLHGLLMTSGNDAALAVAEHVGGSVPGFVELMNAKAQELGLRNTQFANPHGLDQPGLYSSAFDMAVLGRRLLGRADLAEIVSTTNYQPVWDGPQLWNGNRLLYDYPESVGVKTGYTVDAGQTIVAAAERDGRRIIVSLFGSWDRYSDAIGLFEWAFTSTEPACGTVQTTGS